MGKVASDMSMSLDGFIAGLNDGVERPLGDDEVQIHLVPVLLGEGRRLFDHLAAEHIELERTRVIDSPGVTHLRFRVVK